MFGWGRKTDGFEWHKYVRTTIRLKREDRRIRVEGVKLAALEGAKDAGRAGVKAGVSGLAAVWNGAVSAVQWIIGAAISGGLSMARTAAPAARSAIEILAPWSKRLAHGGLSALLLAVGLIALHAAFSRSRGAGLGGEALVPAVVALIALGASLTPILMGHLRWQPPAKMNVAIGQLQRRLPGWAKLPPRMARGLGIAVTAVVITGVGFWGLRGTSVAPHFASFKPFAVKPLEGRATAVAGDVLQVGSTIVRLAGIEAPDLEQKCTSGGKKRWPCGEAAQSALTKLVRGKTLRCELSGADDAGRPMATCTTVNTGTSQNVAAVLVKEGAVFSSGGMWGNYNSMESEAKARKIGLWRGEAERPSEFRAKMWEQARKAAPEGCPIKGQVAGDNRTYVLPWFADYGSVRVRTSRGERWFCSEAEARAAGWKIASR